MSAKQSIKLLITGGCSFSQVPRSSKNWPLWLQEYMGCDAIHTAKGATGQGLISKSIIYEGLKALKTHKPEEILVGIMWSGSSRREFYSRNRDVETTRIDHTGIEYYANPTRISPDISEKNYVIINPHWSDSTTDLYYKNFSDHIGEHITSIEHMLRVQWFLKSHNIKYFMMLYATDAFPLGHEQEHEDLKHLVDEIDFDNFVSGEYNMLLWCVQVHRGPFPEHDGGHPSSDHQEAYTHRVIIPHLIRKGYINGNT